ncbi:hypothetical protein VNI00_015506 [Paramarasmius palmivorus]|uniref:Uncharacterized protein n=1 Tax=Paramarasmius palmivorus TaxID=297713 RepID=A0AAW0BKY4_9AGAR
MWRHPESAAKLRSRLQRTEKILEERNSEGGIQGYSDILHGSDYLNLVEEGKITKDTMLLLYSEDTAQLYRDKESSTLFGIAMSGDLDPDIRHLEDAVIPLFVVGGEKSNKGKEKAVEVTDGRLSSAKITLIEKPL